MQLIYRQITSMNRPSASLFGLALAIALAACRGEQASPANAPPSGQPAAPPPAAQHAPAAQQAPPGSAAASPGAAQPSGAAEGGARTSAFDADKAGGPPTGFSFARTGGGAAGRWIVKAEPGAPSGANVLAQVDTDNTDFRFPVAIADAPSLRDVRLSVRCKAVSGKVDEACGLVFRYRDENNYYVTRANALENNVRLYTLKDGRRKQIAGYDGAVTANAWHELRVDAKGDRIEVYWDGKRIIEHQDSTFPDAGKVGVWTKADSVTYFDDLSAAPL